MKMLMSMMTIGLLSAMAYTGCASPQVKYITNPKEDLSGNTRFMLLRSNILIAKAQEDQKNGGAKVDASNNTRQSLAEISATVVPKEEEATLYAIVPQSSWLGLVKTNISTTFQDNTRLIKQTGVSVDDNRIKAIQAVGTIVGAATVAFAPPPPPVIRVPAVIDPLEGGNEWIPYPPDHNYEYKVIFLSDKNEQQDIDAVETKKFFAKYDDSGWWNSTSSLPISSCRNIVLKIRQTAQFVAEAQTQRDDKESDDQYKQRVKDRIINNLHELQIKLSSDNPRKENETDTAYHQRITELVKESDPAGTRSFPLKIADPRYVRTVRLPDKGSISTHTICGADTKTENSQIVGYQDLLGELAKQAKAVYDTQKAKTKPNK